MDDLAEIKQINKPVHSLICDKMLQYFEECFEKKQNVQGTIVLTHHANAEENKQWETLYQANELPTLISALKISSSDVANTTVNLKTAFAQIDEFFTQCKHNKQNGQMMIFYVHENNKDEIVFAFDSDETSVEKMKTFTNTALVANQESPLIETYHVSDQSNHV